MVIAVFELAMYLNAQGVEKISPGNPGGTITRSSFDVTFTKAFHSSSTIVDGKPVYLGQPCGILLRSEGKTVYHMGDTEIFGDMALVQEFFQPDVGCVPIGDRFTMGAKQAAIACKRYLQVQDHHPDPLRHLPDHRPGRLEIPGRDGGAECRGAGSRRAVRGLSWSGICCPRFARPAPSPACRRAMRVEP